MRSIFGHGLFVGVHQVLESLAYVFAHPGPLLLFEILLEILELNFFVGADCVVEKLELEQLDVEAVQTMNFFKRAEETAIVVDVSALLVKAPRFELMVAGVDKHHVDCVFALGHK